MLTRAGYDAAAVPRTRRRPTTWAGAAGVGLDIAQQAVAGCCREDALAEDLLTRGAVPDARDADGYTALMYAANRGHDGCVSRLLTHGANPNAADEQGSTPLMFAAQHGHTRIVERLLDAGADPDSRGDHGFTALEFAEQNGHNATVNVLIQAQRSR